MEKKGWKIGMILEKETIEKAVNWWAEKVTANQPHSNGDNSNTSIVACLFIDSMAKKISEEQVEVFKKELAMRIRQQFNPELRYFVVGEKFYTAHKREIIASLKKRRVLKDKIEIMGPIVELGR